MSGRIPRIEGMFAGLRSGASSYKKTSNEDPLYNCFGFANGDTKNWWQPPIDDDDPLVRYYWPPNVPAELSPDAVAMLFEIKGYVRCTGGELESGFEKVAIYVLNGEPTHAARQTPDGHWSSKIGPFEDIEHSSIAALEGARWGFAEVYLKRPLTTPLEGTGTGQGQATS